MATQTTKTTTTRTPTTKETGGTAEGEGMTSRQVTEPGKAQVEATSEDTPEVAVSPNSRLVGMT